MHIINRCMSYHINQRQLISNTKKKGEGGEWEHITTFVEKKKRSNLETILYAFT